MEFLDDEPRPRFMFQSRPLPCSSASSYVASPQTQNQLNKPFLFLCVSLSVSLILVALFFLRASQTLQIILLWLASSLLLAPFAPPSLTGGDVRVGQGPIVPFPDHQYLKADPQPEPKSSGRRFRAPPRRSEQVDFVPFVSLSDKINDKDENLGLLPSPCDDNVVEEGEGEWSDADLGLLKKQVLKHPVGKPRRWEIIAESFRGNHNLDSVIIMGKALRERKAGEDSYSQFLKNRKPLDWRIEEEQRNANAGVEPVDDGGIGKESSWTSGEDIALLNALKAFPKEASMRWEKIAAAVPGKSKAACVKRVGELKKGFRNSKANSEA